METKLGAKYKNLLDNVTTLTESEIISLKSRISTNTCSLTQADVDQLQYMTSWWDGRCEYDITKEHSDKVIDYLYRKVLKLNGAPRNTKMTRRLPNGFFEAIRNFERFTFVGYTDVSINMCTQLAPVWRIYTTKGEVWDYYLDLDLDIHCELVNASKGSFK